MSKNHAIISGSDQEAVLKYHMKDFSFIKIGTHVFCAQTGKRIDVFNLRYWNVKRQEPYFDAKASLERELENARLLVNF